MLKKRGETFQTNTQNNKKKKDRFVNSAQKSKQPTKNQPEPKIKKKKQERNTCAR